MDVGLINSKTVFENNLKKVNLKSYFLPTKSERRATFEMIA